MKKNTSRRAKRWARTFLVNFGEQDLPFQNGKLHVLCRKYFPGIKTTSLSSFYLALKKLNMI